MIKTSSTLTILCLEFTFQKSGWYRQNQNAVLVFVFIILYTSKFSCFPKFAFFPPNLEACFHYCFCEALSSQSFVDKGFSSRLHIPFMSADVFSSESSLNILKDI